MCYEFELWNWKTRAKRDQKLVPTQSSEPPPQVSKPKPREEPAREARVEERTPA